jgi:hypothetical protein
MSAPQLQDLYIQPGEKLIVYLRRLFQWAKSFELFKADPRVRLNVIPGHGTFISIAPSEDGAKFIGAFNCALEAGEIKVGEGLVNATLVPVINGVRLDGRTSANKTVTTPRLKIKEGPNADLRSWVCLAAHVGKDGKLDTKSTTPPALEIVHRKDFDQLLPGQDVNGIGLEALAMIVWSDKATPQRVIQITLHHLKHEFRNKRHFFHP